MIVPLNLPKANLKLTRKDNRVFVRCLVRHKDLVLTPEEWVRQHVINFLHQEVNVPLQMIAAEMQIKVNELERRCDLVIYSKEGNPLVIVECKAPEVTIDEKVLFQIAQYNRKLQVPYLMMTNGIDHYYAKINYATGELHYMEQLPDYSTLI